MQYLLASSITHLILQIRDMEVAGVVLGAIPIVITALQYSKDMKRFTQRFSDRKSIIRRLIEALQLQQGELELNLEWLSKAMQLEEEPASKIQLLLARPDIQCKVVDYLGSGGSKSFILALEQAQRAVENVSRNIRGFLVDTQVREQDSHFMASSFT